MNIRKQISDLRKEIKSLVFAGGKLPKPVTVEDIPKEWTLFGDSKTDYIKGIEIPDKFNSTACLYEAKKGSYFPIHRHPSTESIICLGNCVFKTPFEEIELKQGDCLKIDEEVLHEAQFLSDSLLVIVWHPEFEDDKWVATS